MQDEEQAKQRLYDAVKKMFPEVEEGSVACEAESLLDKIKFLKEKASYYDQIRQHAIDITQDAYERLCYITPDNQKHLQELVVSIQSEQNNAKRIKIYPINAPGA